MVYQQLISVTLLMVEYYNNNNVGVDRLTDSIAYFHLKACFENSPTHYASISPKAELLIFSDVMNLKRLALGSQTLRYFHNK